MRRQARCRIVRFITALVLAVLATVPAGPVAAAAITSTVTAETITYGYDATPASTTLTASSWTDTRPERADAWTAVGSADSVSGSFRAAEEAPGIPRYVYRGGSNSADNLTPRFSDTSGLSTFDNLEAATPPGGKAQIIDTTRLRCLIACPDAPPPGHVSIRPRDPADLQDWMAARSAGRTHPFAQELQDAIVDVVRRPR